MQVEIKIDASYTEPKIIILTASMTDDVSSIVKKLTDDIPQIITGSKDDKMEVLEQADLIRIYANAGKVFAVTDKGEYKNNFTQRFRISYRNHNRIFNNYTDFRCLGRRILLTMRARTDFRNGE